MEASPIPAISVLLPFHNEGNWLEEAVGSIVDQTFKDWELILIANRPEPFALEMARRVASIDNRILLVSEDRPGIASALNTGIESAGALLIARMDADDYSLPERLEMQVAYMNAHPEVDVLGTRTTSHPGGPPGEGFAAFMDWQNGVLTPEDHLRERFIESPLAHPTVVFRKILVKRHGGYLTTGLPEDYELWLRWMENGAVFAKLPEPLLRWRDHPGRLTRSNPDYAKDAFSQVRSAYLALELKRILRGRKLIVCGANRSCRQKAKRLIDMGISVAGFSDVVQRQFPGADFIPASGIKAEPDLFFLSFVSSRGKAAEMRDFFRGKQMREGLDFILAH